MMNARTNINIDIAEISDIIKTKGTEILKLK